MTQGVISVNPNTMYPLLRTMESDGLIEGRWEQPDRRTRRYYSITAKGRREYKRLLTEVEPFLDSVIRSVTLIKREVYGAKVGGAQRIDRHRRVARRGLGLLLRAARLGVLGRRLPRRTPPRTVTQTQAGRSSGARFQPGAAASASACSSMRLGRCTGSTPRIPSRAAS